MYETDTKMSMSFQVLKDKGEMTLLVQDCNGIMWYGPISGPLKPIKYLAGDL